LTRILGIETSCDETSASVLQGEGDDVERKSLVILSQDVHRVFGGVVPEIASRAHLTSIVPVVARALDDAETSLDEIDAIAVTYAPGLIGALLVGVCYAKSLAFARGIPGPDSSHGGTHLRDCSRRSRCDASVHLSSRFRRTHDASRRRSMGPLSPPRCD